MDSSNIVSVINFGVSLHLLSETNDAGDIVLQQDFRTENNLDKTTIEIEAVTRGTELFIQALNTYEEPGWELVRQDQV